MRGDQSAYAALGLRPGAPRAQVDEAYRRLIKLHHPDRNGGDAGMAAEINRAYTQLRREMPGQPRHRSVPMPVYQPRRVQGRSRPAWLLVLVVALGVGAIAIEDSRAVWAGSPRVIHAEFIGDAARPAIASAPALGRFDEPLYGRVIEAAIRQASEFHALGDTEGAIAYSRDCHNGFRAEPNLALFDACAAFDEATVTLAGAGAAMDSGPFSGSVVMAREMAAARALSDDVLGADSRLHQIRSRVELALLPRLDEAATRPEL